MSYSDFIAVTKLPEYEFYFAVELMTASPVRVWNGLGDKVIAGNTYVGAGNMLNISEVKETGEIEATQLEVQLAGVPTGGSAQDAALWNALLSGQHQGRRIRLYLGASSGARDGQVLLWAGFAGPCNINDGEQLSLTLRAESDMARLERISGEHFTDAWQQKRYPGDKGFEFVSVLQRTQISWGKPGNGKLPSV